MRDLRSILGWALLGAAIVVPGNAAGHCRHDLAGTIVECATYTDSMVGPPIDSGYVAFVPVELQARSKDSGTNRARVVPPAIIGVLLTPPGRDLPPIMFQGTPRTGTALALVALAQAPMGGEVPDDRSTVALLQAARVRGVHVTAHTPGTTAAVRVELRRGGRLVANRTMPQGGELVTLDTWPNAVASAAGAGSTMFTWSLTGTGTVWAGKRLLGRGDQLTVTLPSRASGGVGPVLLRTSGFDRLVLRAGPAGGAPEHTGDVSPAPKTY